MTTHVDPLIQKLWQYGHFRRPGARASWNVEENDLSSLSRGDPEVQEAVRSYQEFFREELDEESEAIHNRRAIIDGDPGPATEWLVMRPRCGAPDYAGQQEANWPDSCRMELEVSWDFDQIAESLAGPAWWDALKSWEDVIRVGFTIRQQFSRNHHIWATDGPLSGSVLAWSFLAQNSCSFNAEQRYNTRTRWNKEFLQSTIAHEVGHALGTGHIQSRQALMYPSITSIVTPQPLDIERMVNLGYDKRTDEDPPPPEPTPGLITGTLRDIDGTDYLLYGIPQED